MGAHASDHPVPAILAEVKPAVLPRPVLVRRPKKRSKDLARVELRIETQIFVNEQRLASHRKVPC